MTILNLYATQNRFRVAVILFFMAAACGWWMSPSLYAADQVDAGFRTFAYGSTCNSTPTGEKPESKLWFHDGYWWGSLCNGSANEYRIYRLDLATQDWVDTETVLDDRPNTKADVLWDRSSQKLYVASHVFTSSGSASSSSSNWGRLYRYSYNASSKTYALDGGFPVEITRGRSETLTIAKDATGQLWVTYVEDSKVMVNHSRNGNDVEWDTPYQLPVTGSAVSSDDISAIIAYENYIGIMWSNQSTKVMYFARHDSNNADDQSWQSVSAYNPGGSGADDHINLKSLQSDSAGRIFAVTKTSFSSPAEPLILLLVCDGPPCTSRSQWHAHLVYTEQNGDTRPILLIDTDNRDLHVFTTNTGSGGEIRHKSSRLDNISFPSGEGDLFIANSGDSKINNPTSTKQNVNGASGIVVLASSQTTEYYYHNYIDLGGGGGGGPTNQAPIVNAGADQNIVLPGGASLSGSASDDGLPNPPGSFATAWSLQSGPASVTFSDASSVNSIVSFSQPGTYIVRLTASDGALTGYDDVTITVTDAGSGGGEGSVLTFTPVADAMVKSSSSSSNYGLEDYIRLRGAGAPYYNSYLQFSVTGLTTAVQNAKLRLYVTDGSNEGGSVYLVSNDGSDGAAWNEGAITWDNAPVMSGSPLSTLGAVNSGEWVEYDVTAAIGGNGLVSFGLDTASSNSALFSSKEGPHAPQLVITVASGGGGPTNQPPAVDAGEDQAITLPSGTTMAGTVTDDGLLHDITYTWSQVSGPDSAAIANVGQLDTPITFPVAGEYVLQLTGNDGEHVVSDEVSITVNAAPPNNQPPTVDAGADQTITLPNGATMAGAVTDDGLLQVPLNTWSQVSGPGTAVFGNVNQVDTAVTFPIPGTYILKLMANDGEHAVSDEVAIVVNDAPPGNQPPTVNAGADQTIVLPNSSATMAGVVSDDGLVEGSTNTWSQVSGPETVLFVDVNQLDTAVSFPLAGDYLLRLTAYDGEYEVSDEVLVIVDEATGGSGEQTFTAVADAMVKSSSATRNYGSESYIRLRGSNAPFYNSYVQFDVIGISGPVQSAKLRLYVTDGSDVGGLFYSVSNSGTNGEPWTEAGINWNNAPNISGSPLGALGAVTSGEWVEVDVTRAISRNGRYSFGLDTPSSNSALFSSREGANPPELLVTYGGDGGSVNVPPTVNAGPDQNITLPSGATMVGLVDDDGLLSPASSVWSQVSGPAAALIDNVNLPGAVVAFPAAGTYVLRLTANDGEHTVSDDITITVNDAPPGNQPPTVNAGADQTISLPNSSATMAGVVSDDGLVEDTTNTWSQVSGPETVLFVDVNQLDTVATFPSPGTYVLRLTANDGEHAVNDEVTIIVNESGGGGNTVQTFTAAADAMVKSSSPTRNYGDVSTIRLRDTAPFYNSYIQFNVTGLSGPVQNVVLRLYVTDASNNGGSVYAVSNLGRDGIPWTESTLTWESAPVISGNSLSTLGAVESDTWVEFDVTAAVTGNGLYAFGFSTASTNSVLYSSKEGAQAPELVVTSGVTLLHSSSTRLERRLGAMPSVDLPEQLLEARLVQELQWLDGGVMVYLPLANRP